MEPRVSNINTLADYIDRLIVEVNKISWLEAHKHEEHKKETPDIEQIAYWDKLSRRACNLRGVIKNKINETLAEIIEAGEYPYLPEVKTFGKPDTRFSDHLADRCHDVGNTFIREEMADALLRELKGSDL